MSRGNKKHILIIDDDEDIRFTAQMVLGETYRVEALDSPQNIEQYLQKQLPDLVLLDMNFQRGDTSGKEGFTYLRKLNNQYPSLPIVLITAYGDIPLAVRSMKEGATDFIAKPWENTQLLQTIQSAITTSSKAHQPSKSSNKAEKRTDMVFQSSAMEHLFNTVEKVAPTDAEILILGENGTGKEVLAEAIHQLSNRAKRSFVKVDVGAIPESLFESELFGHRKGAFTDAHQDRAGRFEQAQGGTLFLDEIGNLALSLQAKLLSALQNRQIFRLGESQPRTIDVRLICATNMPLSEMVAPVDGSPATFRQDLLYRINTVEIQLPALRERTADIAPLAHFFLDKYREKYQRPQLSFHEKTLGFLATYDWPGNVRELAHAMERAVIMADSDMLEPHDFPLKKGTKPMAETVNYNLEQMEKDTIIKAIEKHKGNMTQVAKELGMGRTTLYRRMEKYGL